MQEVCLKFQALEHLITSTNKKISWTLHNLPLFTMCSISVRCKPNYIDSSYGYWSEPQLITFRSQEGGEYDIFECAC